ncbi:MAG: zinc dependent phospholipase C family protein [Bacteroidales bacterium]
MSFTRRRSRHPRCLVVAVLALLAVLIPFTSTYGWKIETHVWIAQQVLNDVIPDGKVTLPGFGEYELDPVVWESLKRYPNEYRAGSMGPDAFPDLVGGQMTTHPGLENGWRTDVWLRWVASRTNRRFPSPELAFAFGYLTHAASDVFGHSYINSYAGDIFVLTEDQEAALRHVAAETYIKDRNPALLSHTGEDLGAPYGIVDVSTQDSLARFVRDTLILNPQVKAQYAAAGGATAHLVLMYDFWAEQGEALKKADAALVAINGQIATVQHTIDVAQSGIDSLKNQTGWLPFVGRFHIYPLYCFFDLATCTAVWTAEASLGTTRASLDLLKQANTLTVNSVRAPIQNWRNDVEEALKQYIITSQEVAKALMHPGEDPKAKLTEWACKYAPVFAAIPDELTVAGCTVGGVATDHVAAITKGVDDAQKWISENLPPPLNWIVNPLYEVKTEISTNIVPGVVKGIVGGVAGENSTAMSLVNLRYEGYGAPAVNEVFTDDDSGLGLLKIVDVADRMRRDMGAVGENDPFDPEAFNAVHNSIVMSKLALLSASALNRLTMDARVYATIYGPTLFPAASLNAWGTMQPTNVLFDAVASIDGNQQWQEVALPYPRQAGDTSWPFRRYGYPFSNATSTGGLRFWQDCEARAKVFKVLFRGPLAPSLVDMASTAVAGWESASDAFPLSADSKDVTKFLALGDKLTYVCGAPPAGPDDIPAGAVIVRPGDETPPTIEAPPDVVVPCTAGGKAGQTVELGDPLVADDVDRDPRATNDAPATFGVGTKIVTWTVTDWVGLTAQAQQSVTVFDDVKPVFTGALSPVTAFATSPQGAQLTLTPPTATDSCSGTVAGVQSTPLTTFPLGETTVIWLATDSAGNTARVTQVVTVTARPGDLDIDGDVDPDDLKILLDARGQAGRTVLEAPVLDDYNGNGEIDDADRAVFTLIQQGRHDPRDLNGDFVIDAADVVMLVQLYTHKSI